MNVWERGDQAEKSCDQSNQYSVNLSCGVGLIVAVGIWRLIEYKNRPDIKRKSVKREKTIIFSKGKKGEKEKEDGKKGEISKARYYCYLVKLKV